MTWIMNAELESRRAFAERLADAARAVIRPYFRRRIEVVDKGAAGPFDPVTEADRRAEQTMRDLIQSAYPDDGIIGEEFGEKQGDSGFAWVLDPVDGTRAFIAGQPLWGTLIALEWKGAPVLGVLDQPFLDERFTGFGGTTTLRHASLTERLKTRPCAKLEDAVIGTTHPVHFKDADRQRFSSVESRCRLSRYGGDCYGYALVAMGFVDLIIEADLKRWDIAALIPIIEGAGGIVTSWQGRSTSEGGNVIAAGDPRVHAEALKVLAA